MSSNVNPELSASQMDLASKLVRMRIGCSEYDQNTMVNYLYNNYEIVVSESTKPLTVKGKLTALTNNDGYNFHKDKYEDWVNFIDTERALLKKELFEEGSFGGSPNKFNFNSAFDLIRVAEKSEQSIYVNTYIDLDEWHSPLVHMHLCVQKAIEQKNNLLPLLNCYREQLSDPEKKGVHYCNKPPVYRHLRILILPFNFKQFKDLLTNETFLDNLRYSTLMHYSLSIQLGLLTITDFTELVLTHGDFFKNTSHLEILGLQPELAKAVENSNREKIFGSLYESVSGMGKIPKNHFDSGIDFVCMRQKLDKYTENDAIWTAHNSRQFGLTYQPVGDAEYCKVKNKFTDIIFRHLTERASVNNTDYSVMDPLHPFYANELDETPRHFQKIKKKYNSLDNTQLDQLLSQ